MVLRSLELPVDVKTFITDYNQAVINKDMAKMADSIPDCAASGLCWKYSATGGHCAGIRLDMDTHTGDGGADHYRDQNHAGRPDAAG